MGFSAKKRTSCQSTSRPRGQQPAKTASRSLPVAPEENVSCGRIGFWRATSISSWRFGERSYHSLYKWQLLISCEAKKYQKTSVPYEVNRIAVEGAIVLLRTVFKLIRRWPFKCSTTSAHRDAQFNTPNLLYAMANHSPQH